MENKAISLVWLRRDLRADDHAALAQAAMDGAAVQPVFMFDSDILGRFTNSHDRRLSFIAHALSQLHGTFQKRGGGLLVVHGRAQEILPKLAHVLNAKAVYAGEDYEPSSKARDTHVMRSLGGIPLRLLKDHVIFAPDEVLKDDGSAFKVFTPYSKSWHTKFTPLAYAECKVKDDGRYANYETVSKVARQEGLKVLDATNASAMLETVGYKLVEDTVWNVEDGTKRLQRFTELRIKNYATARDMVAEDGTSQLSPYLRFGLISVRQCLRAAMESAGGKGSETWIKELIWREFYAMILHHYPESTEQEWNKAYRGTLEWQGTDAQFAAWQEGKTGYPIVDAAMRQLLETGWMHNRARMIVASFLTKDLLIDWRRGEEHFAQYLMDYEQASNVGGWQWAASTGTDAQPWFRIFNPTLQSKKFDPKGDYIRRYVPELRHIAGDDIHEPWKLGMLSGYVPRIVDHASAREAALGMFKKAAQ